MTDRLPILAIGLGNKLLRDDGVGLHLVEQLKNRLPESAQYVEYVDGGTQGLALLGVIAQRKSLLILDAVSNKSKSGTVHKLTLQDVMNFKTNKAETAHESSATELLGAAMFVDDIPENVMVVGIEPEELITSLELSDSVVKSIPNALVIAEEIINKFIQAL